jgi:hypothetical protein
MMGLSDGNTENKLHLNTGNTYLYLHMFKEYFLRYDSGTELGTIPVTKAFYRLIKWTRLPVPVHNTKRSLTLLVILVTFFRTCARKAKLAIPVTGRGGP